MQTLASDIGIVFQNHLLPEFRTAADNVALQEIVRGTPKAEAVRLSDRVVVLSTSPGRVAEEITVDVPHPRPLVIDEDPALIDYSRGIYELFNRLGVFDD